MKTSYYSVSTSSNEHFLEFIGAAIGVSLVLGAMFLANRLQKRNALREIQFEGRQFNRQNLLEVYVRLGALMISSEHADIKQKIQYLHSYTNSRFNTTKIDINGLVHTSFKYYKESKYLTKWLNTYLSPSDKSQLLYFLAGLSVVDGRMNSREIRLIEQLCFELDISKKDFDSIIAMYTQQQQRKVNNTQPNQRRIEIRLSCKILGVSEHASFDEIKKAYRTMVKKHHPDRFSTRPKEEQEIAKERFVEIQKAYELLEALK